MKTTTILLLLLACPKCAFSQTVPPTQQTLTKPRIVQEAKGYNSWPMIQAIGETLMCVYSRGSGHTIGEDDRAVYARTSADRGKTWTAEAVVANSPGYGDVEVGKGLDSNGAMLLLGAPGRQGVAPRPLSDHGWCHFHFDGHAAA